MITKQQLKRIQSDRTHTAALLKRAKQLIASAQQLNRQLQRAGHLERV